MIEGQISIFNILEDSNKIIKRTNEYEIFKYKDVYRIHFYDKGDKCRVTKNLRYIKKFLWVGGVVW